MKLSRSFSNPLSSLSRSGTPSLPRSPSVPNLPVRSGTPSLSRDGFDARPKAPTVEQLQQGRANLRPTDYGMVHPDLPGIRTRRDQGQSAAQFTDLTQDARASTHQLMAKDNGRLMLQDINSRTSHLNPGRVGTPNQPLTAVDIYSGRDAQMPMAHRPRHDGTMDSIRNAYRYDGVPGAGQASRITYDETAASANRFNSLGHEGVHAWRAANGLQVSPLEISPKANAPVIRDNPPIVGQAIGHHSHMQEEFETVGLRPTPHAPHGWAPNENLIRQEHGLPSRNDYSGQTPAKTNEILRPIDEGTDNRSWFAQKFGNQPSPVGDLINHLEG